MAMGNFVFVLVLNCFLYAPEGLEIDLFDLGVINYGHLISQHPYIRQKEEAKMLYAMEYVGFMVLTNHGVPKQVMDDAWNATRQFFDTTDENKQSVLQTEDYIYGYSADEMLSKSETVEYFANASSVDDSEETVVNDQKEMFSVWVGAPNTGRINDALWPQEPLKMKERYVAYYRELEKVAAQLLRSLASILNLNDDYFEPFINDHMSAIRALNYPAQTDENQPPKDSLRCSAHSDYGTFTLLRQDGVGGLQLDLYGNETWVDVISEHYDFIVNLGNTMKLWTNDRFKSTRHRVVNPRNQQEAQRRQSIAFFHNLNANAVIETFPSCKNANGTSKYAPIRFEEFLQSLHHGSQTNYEIESKSEL